MLTYISRRPPTNPETILNAFFKKSRKVIPSSSVAKCTWFFPVINNQVAVAVGTWGEPSLSLPPIPLQHVGGKKNNIPSQVFLQWAISLFFLAHYKAMSQSNREERKERSRDISPLSTSHHCCTLLLNWQVKRRKSTFLGMVERVFTEQGLVGEGEAGNAGPGLIEVVVQHVWIRRTPN